ncbi:BrnA antitoxin family protein [Enterovirga sp. CN4-39]|uniref:BrnA antitoxin family protein n=1 Tax=Enterovirga sp. CN4-39 TaxID=3400910 RepID=UPI003BFAEBF1
MSRPPLTDDDGEVRELTAEDATLFRPSAEVDPGVVEAMQRLKKGGRPKVEAPKAHIGFRMAADLVEGIRGTGRGYNVRVEKVLREALDRGELNADEDLPKRRQAGRNR